MTFAIGAMVKVKCTSTPNFVALNGMLFRIDSKSRDGFTSDESYDGTVMAPWSSLYGRKYAVGDHVRFYACDVVLYSAPPLPGKFSEWAKSCA